MPTWTNDTYGRNPYKEKRCYYELIRAVMHNKADLKKGCIPQTERDDGWMLDAVQEVIIREYVPQNDQPMRVAEY